MSKNISQDSVRSGRTCPEIWVSGPVRSGNSYAQFGRALLVSTNQKYDKRLFIDLPVQYMKSASSEHVVYINCFFCFCFDIQNNSCTQHVLTSYAVFMY